MEEIETEKAIEYVGNPILIRPFGDFALGVATPLDSQFDADVMSMRLEGETYVFHPIVTQYIIQFVDRHRDRIEIPDVPSD